MMHTSYPTSTLATIAKAVTSSGRHLALVVEPGPGPTPLGDRLEAAARAVHEGTAGAVAQADDLVIRSTHRPALHITADGRQVAHYLAAPVAEEAPPFLDLLYALCAPPQKDRLAERLAGLTSPCELLVFCTPGCPNCPQAVRAANTLAATSPHISVTVVDATAFSELAASYNVRSVPTTVIDGGLTRVGVLSLKQLTRLIVDRGTHEHDRQHFNSLLDAGRFDAAAERLIHHGAAPLFAEMWSSSSLEQRIGLTLTADEALSRDRAALSSVVPELIAVLESADPARQGDTADLLAKIGDRRARPALEHMLRTAADPDLAEVAEDALAELDQLTRASDSQGQ